MSTITPNIAALKVLAAFNIDAQFLNQYGAQIFNYSGESTPEYEAKCAEFSTLCNSVKADADSLLAHLPPSMKK